MQQNSLSSPRPLTTSRNTALNSREIKSLSKEKILHVNVICNYSKEDYSLFFSNKLNGTDTKTQTRTMIKRILDLDNKNISNQNIPLDVRGSLGLNHSNPQRVPKILGLYNIHFQNELIMKCRYKAEIPNIRNNLLRIFAIYKDDNLDIVLIDPHHLVATEDYAEMFRKSRNLMRCDLALLKKYNIFE